MDNKEFLLGFLKVINDIEVRGKTEVRWLYKLFAFIQEKLKTVDESGLNKKELADIADVLDEIHVRGQASILALKHAFDMLDQATLELDKK